MKIGYICAAMGFFGTVAFAVSVPGALQGAPGLYDIGNSSNMALLGRPGLQNMSAAEQKKLSDAALGQAGLHFQVCVPKGDASALTGMMHMGPECHYSHEKISATAYDADVTCHGMSMHLAMAAKTADTREIMVEMQKMPNVAIPMEMKYTFHRVSASCGDLKPGSLRTPDGKILKLPK